MKTIFVPVGGGEGDARVFETARAAAVPLKAHLSFYHVKVGAGEAISNTPHADFAMGPGLWSTLGRLRTEGEARSAAARRHVEDFCRQHGIPLRERPNELERVSASWCEEAGRCLPLLLSRARHSDLVVVGRHRLEHLPKDLVERLLLESGRPILVAPAHPVQNLTSTAMVCWKECIEAAHAVTAAMPLLSRSARVLIVSVCEDGDADAATAVEDMARQMAWHGIHAEARCVTAAGRPAARVLSTAAQECEASLVVMGGYGHNRIREIIFGGCTEAFLRAADRPVLLVH